MDECEKAKRQLGPSGYVKEPFHRPGLHYLTRLQLNALSVLVDGFMDFEYRDKDELRKATDLISKIQGAFCDIDKQRENSHV